METRKKYIKNPEHVNLTMQSVKNAIKIRELQFFVNKPKVKIYVYCNYWCGEWFGYVKKRHSIWAIF